MPELGIELKIELTYYPYRDYTLRRIYSEEDDMEMDLWLQVILSLVPVL